MNIEEYAKYKYFFTMRIPDLLEKYINKMDWNSYLDIGCGDGNLLYTLNKEGYFQKKKIFAVDLSQNRIRRVQNISKNLKCYVNDACDLKDIKNSSINIVTSTMVLEHVPDEDLMLMEIKRVLKKDCNFVYLSTVFKKWYGWYYYRCNGKWRLDPTHVREYTDDNLLCKLKEKGFEIIETKKSLLCFSFVNLLVRITKYKGETQNNKFFRLLDKLKVPILGYYNWEIVCKKVL